MFRCRAVMSLQDFLPAGLVAEFRDAACAEQAVIYEARRTGCVPIAATTSGSYPDLALHGPLARWPRVNGEVLRLPERADVLDDASSDERQFVARAFVRACVPLLVQRDLVGLVVLIDQRPRWQLTDDGVNALLVAARKWAPKWRNAQGTRDAISRARAEYRSQQLSVAGELAASTAHEVRNPLAAIRSMVQFVRDVEPPDEERRRLLADVLEEVDRVDRTVGNLLQLTKPQPTQHALVDPGELLSRAIEFIHPYARKRDVRLLAPALSDPGGVVGDAGELRQVFVNLLLNACQACEPGGEVFTSAGITVSDQGSYTEIVIRDTGHGIAPADLARVCEPFFTTKAEGTGLGLAICRDLVQRFGGSIAIASTPGIGTEVTVRLPLA